MGQGWGQKLTFNLRLEGRGTQKTWRRVFQADPLVYWITKSEGGAMYAEHSLGCARGLGFHPECEHKC